MLTFTKARDFYDYLFPDTLANAEAELFVAMKIFMYSLGGDRRKEKILHDIGNIFRRYESFELDSIAPKGWSLQKTYIHLFVFFGHLGLPVEVELLPPSPFPRDNSSESDDEHANQTAEKLFRASDPGIMFRESEFWSLPEHALSRVVIKNIYSSREIRERFQEWLYRKIDAFANDEISERYGLLPHARQRNLILNRIADFRSLVGRRFTLHESQFSKYEGVSLIFCVALLWRLDYIDIHDFHSCTDDPVRDERGEYVGLEEDPNFDLFTCPKMERLAESLFDLRMLVLDKVFDEEYRRLNIVKKAGKMRMLEIEREFPADGVRFTDLRKKFPHSEITAKNYRWETDKYRVVEKIRLDADERGEEDAE